MAALRHLVAALLVVCSFCSTRAESKDEELSQAIKDKNITVIEEDFEAVFPGMLVEATLDEVLTCSLEDEFKTSCTIDDEEYAGMTNSTTCALKGCCYFYYPGKNKTIACYKGRPMVGRNRNSGGFYVLGSPVQGDTYAYPGNSIPGPVTTTTNTYSILKPTIIVQKPTGTVKIFRFSYGDYTYSFHKEGRTYDEAKEYCGKLATSTMGSALLEIPSQKVQNFITSKLGTWANEHSSYSNGQCNECQGYWIGGNDKKYEGSWQWESGATIPLKTWQTGYQNWYKDEPNGRTGKNCLSIASTKKINHYYRTLGKWFDADCAVKRYYICMTGADLGLSRRFNYGNSQCAPGTCMNGGTCYLQSGGSYFCDCINGYKGDRCQYAPTPPTTKPPTLSCCSVPSYSKRRCGYPGTSPSFCRHRLDCCYNPITRSCFHPRPGCGGPAPTRQTTTPRPTRRTTEPTTTRSNAYWLKWSGWSKCSRSCGSGRWTRIRGCMGGRPGEGRCIGDSIETTGCNEGSCVVKGWASWGDWSGCTATCGTGYSYRVRVCKTGGTVAVGCPGQSREQRTCSARASCGGWASWNSWSRCSATCGSGFYTRTRVCVGGIAGEGGCAGKDQVIESCIATIPVCPVTTWGAWAQWSQCLVTCGRGVYRRTRVCINGNIGDDGCNVAQDAEEIGQCVAQIPTCAFWGEWNEYRSCSKECGGGTQTKTRVCIGGTDCVGRDSESITCNNQACASWEQWSSWSECNKDCGTGVSRRMRKCIGGESGGPGCAGSDVMITQCNTQDCPNWGDWSEYTTCTKECGGGFARRTRICINGIVGQEGCLGPGEDVMECNTRACESWTEWGSWVTCSAECDGGITTRRRTCLNGVAGLGRCSGSDEEIETCNMQACSSWGPWSEQECSVTCGEGLKTRIRECVDGVAGISDGCLGQSRMNVECREGTCETWGGWQPWGDCSATCGEGVSVRTRECSSGGVSGVSSECSGPTQESKDCVIKGCPRWKDWDGWSTCSATCGQGQQSRLRICNDGEAGVDCDGDELETRKCEEGVCSSWRDWSEWSSCTVTCGGGVSTRTRSCVESKAGTSSCTGEDTETIACGDKECETWLDWGDWSECSVTCGAGTRIRSRSCEGGATGQGACHGTSLENEPCRETDCPTWNIWGEWSDCDVTCGGGKRARERSCVGGEPGGDCKGDAVESEDCTQSSCPSWGDWSSWAACTATCGEGERFRARACTKNGTDVDCVGHSREREVCIGKLCEDWSVWGLWSDCSATCGGGSKSRSRTCKNGNGCEGPAFESVMCGEMECQEWTAWTEWSKCSATCGEGIKTRSRTCSGGDGDKSCEGESVVEEPCAVQNCPAWTQWGDWSKCSETCGNGKMTRARRCTNDPAGDGCVGNSMENQDCNITACPEWGAWKQWSDCSATCGHAEKVRLRQCGNGGVGGIDCKGLDVEREQCLLSACPSWGEWSSWASCTATCGEGERTRARVCVKDVDDADCVGHSLEREVCAEKSCEKLSDWGQWSDCSATCGGGNTSRSRACESDNGCEGPVFESVMCGGTKCPEWTAWTKWGKCSATCGKGIRSRSRACSDAEEGKSCEGESVVQEPCNVQNCPAWTRWSDWSKCSETCGNGKMTRVRRCTNDLAGDGCVGDSMESKECNVTACPGWGTWGEWSDCSATCGPAERVRQRQCGGGVAEVDCEGSNTETERCMQSACSSWGEWSSWGSCTNTCGKGERTRARVCVKNVTDTDCTGHSLEKEICNEKKCEDWLDWGQWSDCSATCGGGNKSRSRTCKNDKGCEGPPLESVTCGGTSAEECPAWSPWSTWSGCSTTCGGGKKRRARICINKNIGGGCGDGDPLEESDCSTQDCPTWAMWTTWSSCTKSCDGGRRERKRQCLNVFSGDQGCEEKDGVGESHEEACNPQLCPRFGPWSTWGACNATCDVTGFRTHSRECVSGQVGELGCEGPTSEHQECDDASCSFWSQWDGWGECTKSCGGGERSRGRLCVQGKTENVGCQGNVTENEVCNEKPCSHWSTWGAWSSCSSTCGDAERLRIRVCVNGEIGQEGCENGDHSDAEACSFKECSGCSPNLESAGLKSGNVTCTDSTNVDSVCTFACEENYQLVGNKTATCSEISSGVLRWSDSLPNCTKLCSDAADIIFVIDSSSSIGEENFRVIRSFVKEIVQRFKIALDAALFGAIRYNADVSKLWDLKDHPTLDRVLQAIGDIPYDGSGTLTGKAIQYTHENMFSEEAGRRPGVPKMVVVITDGVSFDDVREPSRLLKGQGAKIVAVGIGNVRIAQINEIASDPDRNFATRVSSFDSLPKVVSTIAHQIKSCQPVDIPDSCPPQARADMLFIVDSSSSIGNANFELVRSFVKDVVKEFNVGNDAAMFSLILYNKKVTELFKLKDFDTVDKVLSAIDKMPYSGSGTRTGKALRYAATRSFESDAGARTGLPKVTIVITDGKSQDNVAVAAAELKKLAKVISIGVGGAVVTELRDIASYESNALSTDFQRLGEVMEELKTAVCLATKAGTE